MDKESNDSPEEGEIVDYEPLARPTLPPSTAVRGCCGLNILNADSDSDSDNDGMPSKIQKFPKHDASRRSKYNVWASEVQTSDLMDEICKWNAGLTVIDKSRDVESYYCLSGGPSGDHNRERNYRKRRYGDTVDLRGKRRKTGKYQSDKQSHPRFLSDIRVTVDDPIEEVAHDITNKLCEDNKDLMLRAVRVLGNKKVIDLFEKTRSLEEGGGMLIMNGSRRRTPGGVFIQLIKGDNRITKEQKDEIFIEELKTVRHKKERSGSTCSENAEAAAGSADSSIEGKDVPPLLSRKDLVLSLTQSSETSEQHSENDRETLVKNPPPSPATDVEQLEDRQLSVYDDMFDFDSDNEMEFS